MKICEIDGCGNKLYAKGHCQKHYYRLKRNGHTDPVSNRKGSDRFDSLGNVWCSSCERFVPIAEKSRERDNYIGWCRECKRAARYGMTRVEMEDILEAQNGLCLICETEAATHADHDHSCCKPPIRETCGKCFRGILCRQCNAALGKIEPHLVRILQYLGVET